MLESYITPMLMGYIDKYVKNLKPSDLQVSFWGGDAVLRNLELRLNVLEQELQYPLEIKSGRIRELVLHIPWNAILSKPVEVGIKDVEIVVKLKDVRTSSRSLSQHPPQSSEDAADSTVESATAEISEQQSQQGYLQGYKSRILNNVTFHIQNLVVKVIEEECDMMMSFNIQSLKFYMTDEHWVPTYVCTDYCDGDYSLNKVLEVTDMVVHLQTIDDNRVEMPSQKDPFINKCSFSCRMQSKYQGKKFVKKSTCILFESLVFSADENQFSLFFHLLDWLLAMYYSGKRLKGRDDVCGGKDTIQPVPQMEGSSADGHGLSLPHSRTVSPLSEDVLLSGSLGGLEEEMYQQRGEGGSGGWGSWAWSFVADAEGEGEGEGGKREESKETVLLAESSSFAIIAKSITVNLKVTHHRRNPVFSSPRPHSRTVLTVLFSGCSVKVDSVPSTQLFAMSLGILAIQAEVCGVCSCADAIPASWKASSEEREKVFSLGDVNSCDTEFVLTDSLFGPETSSVPPDQSPLPLPELLLATRPEFAALWFTYEYYDVGAQHPVEVCQERLEVGEMELLLCPDTVHRVTHFTSAYRESMNACPLFSEGMVVIGDPKAETSFKINLAGGRAIVTSNNHYLPCSSSSSSEHSMSKSLSKQPPAPPSSPPLPALLASMAHSTITMTSAMYSGNATMETPQRHQMRVNFSQLEISEIENFALGSTPDHMQSNRICSVPKLEIYRHVKTTGDGDAISENDSSYLQLHVEEVSCVVSPEQVSKTGFIYSSWYKETQISGPPRPKIECPPPTPQNSKVHLHISVKDVELTTSTAATFTFTSVIVASCSVVLLSDSTTGRLCRAIPVLCGPVATGEWSSVTAYSKDWFNQQTRSTENGDRLVEFFTAIPHEKHSAESYSTVQLSVGGLAVCLDTAVLDFVSQLPQNILGTHPPESDRECPMGGERGGQTSVHSADTVTTETHTGGVSGGASNNDDIITKLTSYATKVDVKPILIIIPAEPLPEGLVSSLLPEFPVLPALRENSSMETLLVCLPHLSLTSAKSHVLEEPVPKATSSSTLPWDCTLHHACLMAVHCGVACYIVDPLTVHATLADQQGGTGVTLHTDTVALTLANEEGRLLSVCVSRVMDALSPLFASPPPEENEDSGIHSNPPPTPHTHQPTPSHLSSPALSTITTATVTTLPAHTPLSTISTSSLVTQQNFSALWIQAIVTKITLTIFAPLPNHPSRKCHRSTSSRGHTVRHGVVSAQSKTSSTGSYMTPLTSPTGERQGEKTVGDALDRGGEGGSERENICLISSGHFREEIQAGDVFPQNGSETARIWNGTSPGMECGQGMDRGQGVGREKETDACDTDLVKLLLEVDGVSVQFDVQAKCTDLILKLSAIEASLYRRDGHSSRPDSWCRQAREGGSWDPYLSSEKILSSKGSTLPQELCDILTHSSPAAVHMPQGQPISSTALRNFVTLELTTPRHTLHRAATLMVKVQSFEAVVWLPIVDVVSSVLSSMVVRREEEVKVSTSRQTPPEVSLWPAIEANVECCRFVLPSSDYSTSILCNIGCVAVSHSLDYPTTDVRYVVSASALRRLTQLSSERKQPPLPAYQMDVLSVSVWGVCREEGGSNQVLLYAGSSDVRAVYTPALYWFPTGAGTSQRPAILACGHCVEINFTTDLSLVLGPRQVNCVMTILQSNMFSNSSPTPPDKLTTPTATPTQSLVTTEQLPTPTTTPTQPSKQYSPSRSRVPFKGLVSGTTVGLTLVSTPTAERDRESEHALDSASETTDSFFPSLPGLESMVVPLLQVQLHNLLCGVYTSTSGRSKYEASCFNMAVSHCDAADTETTCNYVDLVNAGMMSSLLDAPLLETRRGRQQNTREIPPSVVSMVLEVPHHKPTAFSVDVNRPVKLKLSPQLIQKLSKFSDSILKSVNSHCEESDTTDAISNDDRHDQVQGTRSQPLDGKETHESASLHTAENDGLEKNSHICTSTAQGVDGTSDGGSMQVKVKTTQVLVEFQLSSRSLDLSGTAEERETASSLEGEMGSQRGVVSMAEEGLLLVWDHLDLAYPNVTGSTRPTSVTGDTHINGLQLLGIRDCTTTSIVLPTQLNCFLSQHIPSSPLDLAYVTVNLSCGLLDVRVSREVVDLATRVLQTVSDLIRSQRGDPVTNGTSSTATETRETEKIIHFHDDLRAGDFSYIKDSDVALGYSVRPGEVFFSLGSQESVTSMMWHYREPRAITKLSILPVPFSFTSEADTPIDIEVGCTLDYWDEDRGMFSVLEEFRLSETTPIEIPVSRVVGSRKWRIAIVEVEWEDDEEGESTDLVDGEGAPIPIASILSPVLLAGGTCVDSYFSPQLVPVSDFSITCHGMQTTVMHNTSSLPGRYDGYEVMLLTSGPQELMRVHVQHMTSHMKQMRNGDTTLQIDGRPSVEFIDFLDLTWRMALYPTHLHAHLERQTHQQVGGDQHAGTSGRCDITLKCSPAVVRCSQGLLHTTSLALRTWTSEGNAGREEERGRERGGEGEGEEARIPIILNHFILCNNTLQDLQYGQVATDEVRALRSRECVGYSWRNHKIVPQTLHLCLVTDGVWRWTKPFSITRDGTQVVEVYVGRHVALVSVCVTNIGGLQKQVTLTGNWSFSSTLPFPLHLSLVSSQDVTTPTIDDVTTLESRETLLLPAKSSLASLVVPTSGLSGLRVRSPVSSEWSDVYPIHSTADEWTKPQLLTEMEYSSGQRVNLWYNIKPMQTVKCGKVGSQVTFSPLFAVCNHLPFDLVMVGVETNAFGPAPISLPECVLKGKGKETILCGLHAETWYHLRFRESGCEGVSEPTISLSTFLLIHLPFSGCSEGEEDGDKWHHKWPYEDDITQIEQSSGPASTTVMVMLPLSNGSHCSLHAILERNPSNTITLHLQPDKMIVNHCPHSIQLLTRLQETTEEDKMAGEVVSVLNSNDVTLIPQNKFLLLAEREGKTLLSQLIIADPEKKEQSTNVILTQSENNESTGVFGNLTLVQRFKGAMTIISIIPTYVFHNNTAYNLSVSTSLFYSEEVHELHVDHSPLVTVRVPSKATQPLLFWEHSNVQAGSGDTVQALKLKTTTLFTDCSPSSKMSHFERDFSEHDMTWSLPLSPDFVRHSFALPISSGRYMQAVLTMHEHANTVYMIASEDPAPRLLIQNHTRLYLEVSEEATRGIDQFPQPLPPMQEVTYEPPTYAKQYPIVFDGEVVEEKGKKIQRRMKTVAVKFRLVEKVVDDGDREGGCVSHEWSDPFHLTSDSDRILAIPGAKSILVSTHRKGVTLYLTLLPTGEAVSTHPDPLGSSGGGRSLTTGKRRTEMSVDVRATQIVVCLDDEVTEECRTIDEILQVVIDGAVVQFSSMEREGTGVEVTVDSFHINNMTETGAGDFAVVVIPREEHSRRASLIESDPVPLARLFVHYSPDSSNLIDNIRIAVQPLTLQLEDGLLNRLKSVLGSYSAPGILHRMSSEIERLCNAPPEVVLVEAERDVVPLAVTKLVIESASFYLNARISLRVLLSCNDSPFRFSRYELENVYSNWTEVSQTVASRYVMSTIAHVGWLLGSLDLIGSPGTFIQNVGRGLRDLVTLPYQGLTRSPTWFLLGIGQGTMSFVHHLSSGALRSVTSMASSLSHNMERLSLDPHHVSYQTQQRQERPTTHFTMGLISGASSFGLSLMSAVAGIVEQPMQSYHRIEGSVSPTVAARSILTGVGKGLLGAVTKPVGGAMELVSQTGQGLMHGTGLARHLCRKTVELQSFTGSLVRADLQSSCTACATKLDRNSQLLLSTPVEYITRSGLRKPALLLVAFDQMYLLDLTSNTFQQTYSISEYSLEERDSGAGNLEEVEIEIVSNSERAKAEKFHKVEYFLQQSLKETRMLPQVEVHVPASPSLDWSDHELELDSENQQVVSADRAGVKLLIATHHAAQLLSFYNSLSQLSVHPCTAFCMHRTLKSESFLSAKSN